MKMKMKMIFKPSRVCKCVNGLASKFLHIVPVPINVQNIKFDKYQFYNSNENIDSLEIKISVQNVEPVA